MSKEKSAESEPVLDAASPAELGFAAALTGKNGKFLIAGIAMTFIFVTIFFASLSKDAKPTDLSNYDPVAITTGTANKDEVKLNMDGFYLDRKAIRLAFDGRRTSKKDGDSFLEMTLYNDEQRIVTSLVDMSGGNASLNVLPSDFDPLRGNYSVKISITNLTGYFMVLERRK